MANLLSMLGLGSSGVPVSLDDETAQLMAQSPTSGWSALMGAQQGGIAPQQMQQYMAQAGMPQSVQQDDGSQASAQDANAVASDSTGNVASQDSKVAKGDTQNAADAQQVDQSGYSGDDSSGASGSAGAAPNNSDNASTASNASADQSGNTASSPDATTSSDKSLLSAVGGNSQSASSDASPSVGEKLMSVLRNPLINESLMNAGFGMMAASRPGTPWYSAIGQGAQTGVQTYNQLAQQQIANRMAALNYQRQNALDQADINAKNASTAATQQKTAQTAALQSYAAKAGAQFDPQQAVGAGADPQAAMDMFKTLHPNVTVTPMDDAGNMYAINPMTGQVVATVKGSKLTSVAPGASVYNGSQLAGGTGSSPAGGSSVGQVNPQPVVQGGLTPDEVNKNVQGYNATQKSFSDQAQTQDQFLNQMQTKEALSGVTGKGGLVPDAFRQVETLAGVYNNNSNLRQQFQSMNIQKEMSMLPPGARPDQTYLKMVQKTMSNPDQATPEQMMQTAAFARSVAQRNAVDSEVRAAFVGANGGMETPLSKPTSITVQGQTMNLPAKTTMQQAADAATSKLVDWDPPLINPKWADRSNVSDKQIQQALQLAKDPSQRNKLRQAGILLPSNMRNGGQ